MTLIQEEYKL